jgi:hypothetical protein
MTWIVGTPCMFGYGFGISDIRVTLSDGSERDCLRGATHVLDFIRVGEHIEEWVTEELWASYVDTDWHGHRRPAGRYRTIAWIPRNFLSAVTMKVTAWLCSPTPRVDHFREADAVGFQTVDTLGAGTAQGDYTDNIGVRDAAEIGVDRWAPRRPQASPLVAWKPSAPLRASPVSCCGRRLDCGRRCRRRCRDQPTCE